MQQENTGLVVKHSQSLFKTDDEKTTESDQDRDSSEREGKEQVFVVEKKSVCMHVRKHMYNTGMHRIDKEQNRL